MYHPPLIPPINGGKVPSPLVGEGWGEGGWQKNLANALRVESLIEFSHVILDGRMSSMIWPSRTEVTCKTICDYISLRVLY